MDDDNDGGDDNGSFSGAGGSGSEGVNKIPADGGVRKGTRHRKTAFQMETLEKAFSVNRHPSRKVRVRLSVQLGLTVIQVQDWFTKRRQKDEKNPPVKRLISAVGDDVAASGERLGGNEHGGSGSGSSPDTLNSHELTSLNWSKTKKRAWRNKNTLIKRDVEITKISGNNRTHLPATGIQSGLNMARETKESDCSNTDTLPSIRQKDPKPKTLGTDIHDLDSKSISDDDRIGYNAGKTMSETRECAWRNTETAMKKLKPTQKESCDVIVIKDDEFVDPKLESCDSVKKLSSPQSDTVCVQGYQVKRSNAPILKAIFKKHGDIAAECLFEEDIMRSSFLEIVCDLVRKIHTSNIIENMEEIDRRVTAAEAANVNVTWLRAHFRKKMELFKKSNLLMETKKNTILARCAAQKDLKEAEERVELLDLLEKNLNDALMESKGELDSLLQQEFL